MRRRPLFVLLALAMTAAACGAAEESASGTDPALIQSTAERANPSAPAADVREAAAGGLDFAVDAYRELATGTGNLVFSPSSVRLALAMTWAGAGGDTAEQMAEALHLDLPPERMHAALNALDALLASRNREEAPLPDGTERRVVLTIANALWGQEGTAFLPEFLDTLAVNYGAGMRLVDFVGDVEAARAAINDWVSDRTNQRIPELIQPGVLSGLTRLVLTNAVYLDATWDSIFDPADTREGPFTMLSGESAAVEVMHQTHHFPYASGDGWQAVELPYVGGELAMLVLVPDAGRFSEVESALADVLTVAVGGMEDAEVVLGLPKWEFRTQASMVETLRALGMTDAFDQGLADFSGMTGGRDLFVSDVVHEAFVSVDEAGTEAAAAAAVIMDLRAAMPGDRVELEIDRPFVFALRDRATGEILFIGRVADPS